MVVGLGNPGPSYADTRHNVGYRVFDLLEEKKPEQVFLYRPSVFMNTVGGPVAQVARKKGVHPHELLVICDDFSIPLGTLRLRLQGSSGGHNGLDSILASFGTKAVPRVRLGIGPVPAEADPADFVLQRFPKGDRAVVEKMTARAAEAVLAALTDGMDYAMNQFNVSPE
ncbi:MAG: aminoacyl-tRNA hydrolase [Elusimicrobiota bacterium]|jgi:PTH1 family peptidyl-tRNA hydrolase